MKTLPLFRLSKFQNDPGSYVTYMPGTGAYRLAGSGPCGLLGARGLVDQVSPERSHFWIGRVLDVRPGVEKKMPRTR